MIAYLIRRVATSIVVVIGVSIVIFVLLHAIYPSPARAALTLRASALEVALWNKQHGYDDPVVVQYGRWAWQLLHGNLGYSYLEHQTVTSLFANRAGRSAYLSGISLLFALVIAVPLGIYQARKRGTVGDYAGTSLAFVTYSMPVFFLALILIQAFALSWPVLGFEASQSTSVLTVMGDWHDMLLPVLTLTLVTVASFSRYMRSSAMDVLAQDYIKVARAKGLPEHLVMLRHLVRNACLPIITLAGLSVPALLAGNLVVEQVFNYQGLGYLFFTSLGKADYPVLLGYTLIGAVLVVAGNFVADLALSVADPRIRLD